MKTYSSEHKCRRLHTTNMNEGEQTAMADMEHDARVMELAQQQQEALQNLDEIILNQQQLPNTLNAQNQQNMQPEEEEVVDNIPNLPIPNNNNGSIPNQRRQDTIRRRNGLYKLYSMCNIQLYLVISIFFAFLAIYPSHVSFESIRISVNPYSEIYVNQAVNNIKSQHAAAAALDSQGNVININKSSNTKKGMFGWEAVVEHSSKTSKQPSSTLPQNTNTWFDMWEKFTLGMSSHLAEHYSILQQIVSYPSTLIKSTQIEEVTTNNNEANESSSVKSWWLPPWEWTNKHKRDNNNNDTLVGEITDKQHLEKNTKQKNTKKKKIKLHPHLSPILRKIDLTSLSPFLSNKNDGSETVDTSTSTTEEESKHYTTFMNIIDKVFTSTPRLIAVANLLLAVVYLLQTAVADLFLGPINTSNNADATLLPPQDETSRRRRGGREHFFGFLLFKLLIISSVLEPDGIDFFILLSWYTLLSFMRSLSHLAGMTSKHTSQSGEPPCKGSLRLLILVLVCDVAAMSCFATAFHSIGFSELLLLTFDCLLMFFGTVTHIVKYYALTIEESHRFSVQHLEQRQLELHERRNNAEESDDTNTSGGDSREDEDSSLDDELEKINQAVQLDEAKHTNRRRRIEKAIFLLELFTLFLKMVHFIHLWSTHGTSFTLADGVIALHLHGSISMIGKKIAERRNLHRIQREIDRKVAKFPDATDLEIRKASAAGDVCCICLNTMLIGEIKKVPCGHLFHTKCLRHVLERERSFDVAKCPLCRASLVTGRHEQVSRVLGPQVAAVGLGNNEADNRQPAIEQSLMRFSTENIFPAWIPLPNFAFEVVRRETVTIVDPANPNPPNVGWWQRFLRRGGQAQAVPQDETVADANDNEGNAQEETVDVNDDNADGNGNYEVVQAQEQQQQPSFWRQMLILLGFIPLTPEEEAVALDQLTEMFPQYDRADLLRELRDRRSIEAVAEAILLGLFQGIPRGGGIE